MSRLLAFPLVLAGCAAPEPTVEQAAPDDLVSLRVEPTELALETSPSGGLPVPFVAWATTASGAEQPLETVEWSLSNTTAGSIDPSGVFTPSADNGGVTWVTARIAGLEAQATVSVRHVQAMTVGEVDRSLFEGREWVDTDPDVLWAYPDDGVNLPRNTPSIDFQTHAPDGEDIQAWRFRFRSALTDLSVYTDTPGWTADEETWARLVSTNAGGSLTVDLWGVGADAAVRAPQRTLAVNRMDARGSIFYWSTGSAGIVEVPYGEGASDYLTRETTGRCIGCHAVSSTGLMALTVDGGNQPLAVWDMATETWQQAPEDGLLGNFKTYSPDGAWLLSTFDGVLRLHDGATGAFIEEVPLPATVSHVDWSPDGSQVALVASNTHTRDWIFEGGRLVLLPHLGDGTFGPLEELWTPTDGRNAYYPAWSPDGAWLAFNLSTGDSYDDASAELMVIAADGDTPVALTDANRDPELTNSWPRWGPLPDDDILWLAFSSKRSYGTTTAAGTPQIWVTAFDAALAEEGEDPSWPAFWLPGQNPAAGNHIPVWAE